MKNIDWNEQAKRLLKAELVRRGITNEELANLLQKMGIEETKASIDSKISRGTFSAAFLLQSLNAIECKSFTSEIQTLGLVAEPKAIYKRTNHSKKTVK